MSELRKDQKSYYDILEVDDTATPREIEEAFCKLAKKWHPDVCTDVPEASANFKQIAEAYEVLGNSDKRRNYDEAKECRLQQNIPINVKQCPTVKSTFDSGAFPLSGACGVFRGFHLLLESLLNDYWDQPITLDPQLQHEIDVEAKLFLTPEEANRGGTFEFNLCFNQVCPKCEGICKTTGSLCGTCGGKGRIQQGHRLLSTFIPPGVRSGTMIRILGEGKHSTDLRPPGDLILRIQIKPYL